MRKPLMTKNRSTPKKPRSRRMSPGPRVVVWCHRTATIDSARNPSSAPKERVRSITGVVLRGMRAGDGKQISRLRPDSAVSRRKHQ